MTSIKDITRPYRISARRRVNWIFNDLPALVKGNGDRDRIVRRFPFLHGFDRRNLIAFRDLQPFYTEYTRTVSDREHAVSAETVTLLRTMSEGIAPKQILDLGSGFSSFVLRLYARHHPNVSVWSIDDNSIWLERTKTFLRANKLGVENMMLWDQFIKLDGPPMKFDLIFYDLGYMDLRKQGLRQILRFAEAGQSVVILDDVHKRHYANLIKEQLGNYSCGYYSLACFTLDEIGRYAGLLLDVKGQH